jgi:hypothetical protein
MMGSPCVGEEGVDLIFSRAILLNCIGMPSRSSVKVGTFPSDTVDDLKTFNNLCWLTLET